MTLPVIIATLSAFAFAVFSVYLSFQKEKEVNLRKKIEQSLQINDKYTQYQDNLLTSLQEKLNFGQDASAIIDLLTQNLEQLFPYSTVSSIFVKNGKFIFKTTVRESVGSAFIETIKDKMSDALSAATHIQNPEIQSSVTGVALDDLGSFPLSSSFDIPFVVNNKTLGMINVSSTTENLYSEEQIQIFKKNVDVSSSIFGKMTEALSIEKGKTHSLIDSFTDGLFMTDEKNNLIEINKAARYLLHIEKENPTLNEVLASLPNTYNFGEKISLVIAQNQIKEEDEVAVADRLFKIVVTPVLDVNNASGKVIGASVLLHDSTLEKTLTQMKEDFTNIMVHELRSPLTAIKASSQLLVSDADLSPDERNKLISLISDSTIKMLDKITLILDSAKLDAGLFTIKKVSSDLTKLIADRIAVFHAAANEKSVQLRVDVDSNLPSFSFDPNRIDEVLNNLLSNSLKFTPSGGSITVRTKEANRKAIISVTDTGGGIPKDKQHLLFSKFSQVQSSSSSKGTGLGLYVVKGVVEAHGGTVNLESEVGHGTTISFVLPMDYAPQEVSPTQPQTPEQPRMVN